MAQLVPFPPPVFSRHHLRLFHVSGEVEIDIVKDCPWGPSHYYIVIQTPGTMLDVYTKWGKYRMDGWLVIHPIHCQILASKHPTLYMQPVRGVGLIVVEVHFYIHP